MQEHKCVLDSCRKLQEEGFDVTYLPVQHNGIISLEELEESIRPDTSLVSIMTVNNETGVIQPIKEIGAIVRKHRGVYLHTDAAQAAGKIPIDVNDMNVDLMSISGHKLYGPKGVGALYVRAAKPRVKLSAMIDGGGHERGMRSGTLNVPGIVGLGKACEIARAEMSTECERVAALRERLRHVTMIRADVTETGSDSAALMRRFGVVGPPTIVFLDPGNGQEIVSARSTGDVTADAFRRTLDRVGA